MRLTAKRLFLSAALAALATAAAAEVDDRYMFRGASGIIFTTQAPGGEQPPETEDPGDETPPAASLSLAPHAGFFAYENETWTHDFAQLLASENVSGDVVWSFGDPAAPGWMAWQGATGTVSGAAADPGEHAFEVVASYGDAEAKQSYVITVEGVTIEVQEVSLGYYHACALTTAGEVLCWGSNAHGQLGNGTTQASAMPVQAMTGAISVSAGFEHTCAVTSDGKGWCWGNGGHGRRGDGTYVRSETPAEVEAAIDGQPMSFVRIEAGHEHSCGITHTAAAMCWGNGGSGRLGHGVETGAAEPQPVLGLGSGVSEISLGTAFTCALDDAGDVWCWGHNLSAGRAASGVNATPGRNGVSDAIAASVGANFGCALLQSGGVRCWGTNSNGQLGNGSTTATHNAVTATLMAGSAAISDAVDIKAGGGSTCVMRSAAGPVCWGQNNSGQLGDGSTTQRNRAVPVSGLGSGVTAIIRGWLHSCAIENGDLKCWGPTDTGMIIGSTGNSGIHQTAPFTVDLGLGG